MKNNMWFILLDLLLGAGLIALFWLINTFIAFGVFDRDTDIWFIIPAWLIADATIYALLFYAGLLTRWIHIGALIFILVLAGFYLQPAQSNFPEHALGLNESVSEANEDRFAYAEALFFEVEKRWGSPVRQYLLEPQKVFFVKDAEYFWNLPEESYVDSNVQAHLYRNLLLESNRFAPEEVAVEQHFCTNSPHGVVAFQRAEGPLYADLWAVDNFENYQFGQYTKAPCDTLSGAGLE